MPLSLERTSPTTLTVTRRFAAPPRRLWDAHTQADLIPRWMTGPEGWAMTHCEIDPRAGGHARYEWQETTTGEGFAQSADFELLEPPHRIVHVERFHMPHDPTPTPDARVETLFEPEGTGTRMTMTITVASAEAMEAMLATGMEDGMEASYDRIDGTVAEPA